MHSPGVPFREGEHRESDWVELRFYSYPQEGRRNSSPRDALGDPIDPGSHKLGSSVHSGRTTPEPRTTDENLAHETEKTFAVQICWGCFVAEVHSG